MAICLNCLESYQDLIPPHNALFPELGGTVNEIQCIVWKSTLYWCYTKLWTIEPKEYDMPNSACSVKQWRVSLHSPHSPPSGTILFFDRTKVGHCHAISHKVHFNVLATQFSHCTCSGVAHVDVGKSTKWGNESMLSTWDMQPQNVLCI